MQRNGCMRVCWRQARSNAASWGIVQGGSISPLLANIYLHYAFDLWVKQWRVRQARGELIVVRYADDWIAGFQYREDAERFERAVAEPLGRFGLKLHPEKTKLIEFSSGASPVEIVNAEDKASRRPSTSWASRIAAGRLATESSWSFD